MVVNSLRTLEVSPQNTANALRQINGYGSRNYSSPSGPVRGLVSAAGVPQWAFVGDEIHALHICFLYAEDFAHPDELEMISENCSECEVWLPFPDGAEVPFSRVEEDSVVRGRRMLRVRNMLDPWVVGYLLAFPRWRENILEYARVLGTGQAFADRLRENFRRIFTG
jgi:hypothetical protein